VIDDTATLLRDDGTRQNISPKNGKAFETDAFKPSTAIRIEVFTFNTDADRQAFIDTMVHDLGFTPEYATAEDTEHREADKFVVAVRLPDEVRQ
jgi:hypothetical protein